MRKPSSQPSRSSPSARARPCTRLERGQLAFSDGSAGAGTAFTCKVSACGSEITVYLRAKTGFCTAQPAWQMMKSALTIAFNDPCDAMVATAVSNDDHYREAESLVLNFLNGDTVIYWAAKTLGL
jgi:hypothetical protein